MRLLLVAISGLSLASHASVAQALTAHANRLEHRSALQRTDRMRWWTRFLGISNRPNSLRGPAVPAEGTVWVVDLTSGSRKELTIDGGYRSPIFEGPDHSVLALNGKTVVRITERNEPPQVLWTIDKIVKLVGISVDDRDKLLVVIDDGAGHSSPAGLSVKTGMLIPLPYDARSTEQRRIMEQILGWVRVYDTTIVYTKRESKEDLAGVVEWADVYVKEGSNPPANISKCDGLNCGQPSLSPDGHRVVYIRTKER